MKLTHTDFVLCCFISLVLIVYAAFVAAIVIDTVGQAEYCRKKGLEPAALRGTLVCRNPHTNEYSPPHE